MTEQKELSNFQRFKNKIAAQLLDAKTQVWMSLRAYMRELEKHVIIVEQKVITESVLDEIFSSMQVLSTDNRITIKVFGNPEIDESVMQMFKHVLVDKLLLIIQGKKQETVTPAYFETMYRREAA